MEKTVLKSKVVFFYLFTFLISWSAWAIMGLVYAWEGRTGPLTLAFSTLGGLGPLLSLLVLEKLSGQAVRLKQVYGQIKIRGAAKAWWAPAVLAVPVFTLLGNLADAAAGVEPDIQWILPGPDELGIGVLPVMAIHFAAALVTSPLFEEPGWRGFALTNLQARYGRLAGSLIVGSLWWLWHQPMNMTFGLRPSVYGFAAMVAFSFMIDSLFNLSGKNVFTAMLAHQSYGTAITFLYLSEHNLVYLGLLLAFVVFLRFQERRAAPPLVSPAAGG